MNRINHVKKTLRGLQRLVRNTRKQQIRYRDLQRSIHISSKVLADSLDELIQRGFVDYIAHIKNTNGTESKFIICADNIQFAHISDIYSTVDVHKDLADSIQNRLYKVLAEIKILTKLIKDEGAA